VDPKRCQAALAGGAMATDEVMRRVEAGRPFRTAYREVAAALKEGESFDPPPPARIISRRSSTGGLGNLGLPDLKKRIRQSRSWNARERKRFDRAMSKLASGSDRPPVRRSARSS
jgi:argininosuccinate lyase